MSKWESSKRNYEGYGRAMELGDNPEGIKPNYFSDDMVDEADSVNQLLSQVGEIDIPVEEQNGKSTSVSTDLSDPFYKEYMDLLVQTKIGQPELYETYLSRTLEKLSCCPVTEKDVREYVDSQVQIESLKNNLGKFFN